MGAACANLRKDGDGCKVMKCVESVRGLSSNSASPTDTWIVKFKPGVNYEGKPIDVGFMKIWISPDYTINNFWKSFSIGLDYEKRIYLEVVRRILDYRISPNFVLPLGGGDNCEAQDLVPPGITEEQFRRNMFYAYNGEKGRPEINDPLPIFELFVPPNLKYNFIMTEPSDGLTFQDYMITNVLNNSAEFAQLIFQMMSAITVLRLLKLTHNDNHMNNAFIDSRPPSNMHYVYKFQNGIRTFTLPNQKLVAKIYDWDRAYSQVLGNNELLTAMKSKNSENKDNANKDMVKFVCHLLSFPEYPVNNGIGGIVAGGGIPKELKIGILRCLVRGDEGTIERFYNRVQKEGPNCWFNSDDAMNLDDIRIRSPDRVIVKYAEYMRGNILETKLPPPEELNNAWYVDTQLFTPQGDFSTDDPFPIAKAEMQKAMEAASVVSDAMDIA